MDQEISEFISDIRLQEFCDQIVQCLMLYGGLSEEEARHRLEESDLCSSESTRTPLDRVLLFHELPYFWALSLLHRDNPHWYNDPVLKAWPPPAEYFDPDWPNNIRGKKPTDKCP